MSTTTKPPKTADPDSDEMTASEVCALLRVGQNKLKQLIDFEGLPAYAYGGLKQGRKRRFSRAAVLEWRRAQMGGSLGSGSGGKASKAKAAVSRGTAGKRQWSFD